MRQAVERVAAVDHSTGAPVVVLGIGNSIMGDDGIGLALMEALRQHFGAHPLVDWVDGRTGGMELLPVVQDARFLLVLDAVSGQEPGAVRHLVGDQVPRLLASKLSPHQVGLLDILTAARLLGTEPDELEVVGVVPEVVALSTELTACAQAGVQAALPVAHQALERLVEHARATEVGAL